MISVIFSQSMRPRLSLHDERITARVDAVEEPHLPIGERNLQLVVVSGLHVSDSRVHTSPRPGTKAARQGRPVRRCCVYRFVGAGGECGRPGMVPGSPHRIPPASALGSLASVALSSEPAQAVYLSGHDRASSPPVPQKAINASLWRCRPQTAMQNERSSSSQGDLPFLAALVQYTVCVISEKADAQREVEIV